MYSLRIYWTLEYNVLIICFYLFFILCLYFLNIWLWLLSMSVAICFFSPFPPHFSNFRFGFFIGPIVNDLFFFQHLSFGDLAILLAVSFSIPIIFILSYNLLSDTCQYWIQTLQTCTNFTKLFAPGSRRPVNNESKLLTSNF